MHTLLRVTVLAPLLVALSGIHAFSQAPDPLVGTWVLNVGKSKYNPGPAPKSETRTYVVAGPDIKATSKGIDSDGKPTTGEWTVNYDGKDRPLTGIPDADTLSLKRIGAYSTEFALKKSGKIVITGTRRISKDGKTMTIASKGTNARGQTINNVEVFEKR